MKNWATINKNVVPQGGNTKQGMWACVTSSCLLFRTGWRHKGGQIFKQPLQEDSLKIFKPFFSVYMPHGLQLLAHDRGHRVVPEQAGCTADMSTTCYYCSHLFYTYMLCKSINIHQGLIYKQLHSFYREASWWHTHPTNPDVMQCVQMRLHFLCGSDLAGLTAV